jgi:hypothetical protein
MAIIQVQIGRNTIDYVFLDGEFGVNIIIEQLKTRLGLLSQNLLPIICKW